ncbi:hypothetical protein FB451DRAFT_1534777 [Mycena latifolia]|nr:hypothetical protein FB451DRAFT_1534777 [Mycena latifolia]
MYRANFSSVPVADTQKHDGSVTFGRDDDSSDTPLDSAISLLRMSRSAEVPRESLFKSSRGLRLLSLILHSMLVVMHLALIGVWATAMEHRFMFSVDKQNTVHLALTMISTTFGTTLSMRRSLQADQTLTATHDTAAAWAGIGSAVAHIWHQKAVSASLIGVLAVFMYLGNILVLHITTPALFSVEIFPSVEFVSVGTQSLPAFNDSGYDRSAYDGEAFWYAQERMDSYAPGSLYFLPSVVRSPPNETLGLSGGTLYDVLDNNAGTGTTFVNATGFNITCGSVTSLDVHFVPELPGMWYGTTDGTENTMFAIPQTRNILKPGVISVASLYGETWMDSLNSLLLYSTIPIVDSSDSRGPWITLDPPMNYSVSIIQLFACSQILTNQTAVVGAQSRQIVTLDPEIKKTTSAWEPYPGPTSTLDVDNIFDTWGWLYHSMPASNFALNPRDVDDPDSKKIFGSVADVYLIQKLNLHPEPGSDVRSNMTLHELENALSEVVAAMFWTCHIPPTQGAYAIGDPNGIAFTYTHKISNPFLLQRGSAKVGETVTQARLDVVAGLAASIALMLLSLPYSLFSGGAHEDSDLPMNGTGILHAIWLYRNHPELETLLEQVEHPTDDNLREAGRVRTRLIRRRKQKGNESF